jgi:sporulation protein YlmC with PRC-barrel domain
MGQPDQPGMIYGQMGPRGGQQPGAPYGQSTDRPYGQAWQDQGYGMQGQERGGLNRFGYQGGYPQFGHYDPGHMAYGYDNRSRMMDEHMRQGMGFDQQAYAGERGGDLQQAGPGAGRIEVVSAGELVGRSVTDSAGREIGTSRYLVIGAQSGKVHFVMVGSGAQDGLGLGTDLLPVPWQVVDAGRDQRIALSVPVDRLKDLPRVPPSELASVTGPQIVGRISELIAAPSGAAGQDTAAAQSGQQSGTQQPATTGGETGTQSQQQGPASGTMQGSQQAQADGQQPGQGGSRDQIASADPSAGTGGAEEDVVVLGGRYGALVAPPRLMTEGELAGTTVFSADGMPIGDIDEILVDRRRGQVAYVLVSTGGFLGTDQRWLPVPFTAMTWMPTRMGFALRIQSGQLASLPELAQGTPPRFIRGRDLANLYQAFGAEPYGMRPGEGAAGATDDRG